MTVKMVDGSLCGCRIDVNCSGKTAFIYLLTFNALIQEGCAKFVHLTARLRFETLL